MGVPVIYDDSYRFEFGKASTLRTGNDLTLVANGVMVTRALDAADALERQGIRARVINMATVRPIDEEVVIQAARETGAIVTAEEHTVHGGLGASVCI